MSYQVLLFYKYITIENPDELAAQFRVWAHTYQLLGRVLVAAEGINATLEGTTENTENFARAFLQDVRFADVQIKRSMSDGKSFPKLSVKVRNEIVGTHFPPHIDPRIKTAPHLSPEELKQWYIEGKDFVVVDMRNNYEYALGHFKGSINPEMEASRELPRVVEKLVPLKNKTVLTVCTGGIRCEKMSAYLLDQGFSDVHQLDGGMHSYMEKYPGEDFRGALYTFDKRRAMDFGGEREIIGVCHLCGASTENYVNCANNTCHLHFLACTTCVKDDKVYCKSDCSPQ